MTKSFSDSYRDAGVDVNAGYRAVELMKNHISRTVTPGVIGEVGGFGGLFAPDLEGIRNPVLVSGTDGVGTKLKIAFMMDRHNTIGIDCVAMCVNDIICAGARPMFFLDYIATSKNIPEKMAEIVSGVADGCVMAECALIGGETAEMPGFYAENEYDLVGFSVGVVDRDGIPDKKSVAPGDVVIGLHSSGFHSNGFSLIRKALDIENCDLEEPMDELGMRLGDALLTPTLIYVKPVMALMESITVRSVANITGGGFYENLPRALSGNVTARIDKTALDPSPLFGMVQKAGNISEPEMYGTFNMGVGMCVIVPMDEADRALEVVSGTGYRASVIGEIVKGDGGIEI